MSKPFGFEKPLGMRDTLPLLHEGKSELREKMAASTHRWGYSFVETPALEYYDTVGTATSIEENRLFKLLDQEGKMLVLRPDMTAPIARMASSGMKDVALPLRLAYDANVFRAQQREGGRPAEFEQIGVELIGDGSIYADAEVIALMVHVLKDSGLGHFQVAIGHIGYVNILLHEVVGSEEQAGKLRRLLFEKNYVDYRRCVQDCELVAADRDRLLGLLKLRGGRDTMAAAKDLIESREGKSMLSDLEQLADILEDYGVEEHFKMDFTLVSHMDYYTGIVFEGMNGSIGFPIASGGRYDELLGKFGRSIPATGFAVFFDRLAEALGGGEPSQRTCCILFTGERRRDALLLALKKRANNESVVLQELYGVPQVDDFMQRFDEVICYKGEGEGNE